MDRVGVETDGLPVAAVVVIERSLHVLKRSRVVDSVLAIGSIPVGG